MQHIISAQFTVVDNWGYSPITEEDPLITTRSSSSRGGSRRALNAPSSSMVPARKLSNKHPKKLKYKMSENPASLHQTRAGGGVTQLPTSTFWNSTVSSTENTSVRADSHPAVCLSVCVCVGVCGCNETNQYNKPGKTPWWRQRRKSADLPFFSE